MCVMLCLQGRDSEWNVFMSCVSPIHFFLDKIRVARFLFPRAVFNGNYVNMLLLDVAYLGSSVSSV